MSNEEHALRAAKAFMENMVAETQLASRLGMQVSPQEIVAAGFDHIGASLTTSLPLARLMDQSDVLFHAEGPGAEHNMPWIGALSWLLTSVESNLKRLSAAALDLWGADGKRLAKQVDMRVPGILPGSIWIGVKLAAPQADLLPEDSGLIQRLSTQIGRLPALTRYIGDEIINEEIREVSPDPAVRDIQLSALYRLSPTGRRGIHTVEISSPTQGFASLSQRERVVLHEAVVKPRKSSGVVGSFVGDVREADLDKTRLHLRNVEGVGTLRCVVPELSAAKAAALLGKTVRVTGNYLADADGRPRLMFVEAIEPHQVQRRLEE